MLRLFARETTGAVMPHDPVSPNDLADSYDAALLPAGGDLYPVPLAPEPPLGLLTMSLPSAVIHAGKSHQLNFFLAHPCFIRRASWAPGFRLTRLVIGRNDFGDGMTRIDGRYFYEHRVLRSDPLQLTITNTTKGELTFKGELVQEFSAVPEEDDLSCSLDGSTGAPTLTISEPAAAPAAEDRS